MRVLTTAGALLAMAGAAAAATIRVPQDQTTIQGAATAAVDGDVIVIAPGLYEENVTLAANNVTILAAKGAVLDGNLLGVNGDCLTLSGSGTTVQGLTFRNGNDQVFVNGADTTILKCVFLNAASDAITVNAFTGTVVTGCRFLGHSGDSVDGSGDGLVFVKNQVRQSGALGVNYAGNAVVVEGNLFFNMDDTGAVSVAGNNARVARNKITGSDGTAIAVVGDDAVVELNAVRMVDGYMVGITGARPIVRSNSVKACRGGAAITGDDAEIASNRVVDATSTSVFVVTGDAVAITGNSIRGAFDDSTGIVVASATAAGGGLIEANRIDDCSGTAVSLSGCFNITVRGNRASRCGAENESCFAVSGDTNTLETNQALSPDGRGYAIAGNTNTLDGCVSKGASSDGILISGDANVIANCNVTLSGAEGLDNRGTNTQVQNGTYLKNRVDIVNDAINLATIVGGLTTVNFQTGGVGVQPLFD